MEIKYRCTGNQVYPLDLRSTFVILDLHFTYIIFIYFTHYIYMSVIVVATEEPTASYYILAKHVVRP